MPVFVVVWGGTCTDTCQYSLAFVGYGRCHLQTCYVDTWTLTLRHTSYLCVEVYGYTVEPCYNSGYTVEPCYNKPAEAIKMASFEQNLHRKKNKCLKHVCNGHIWITLYELKAKFYHEGICFEQNLRLKDFIWSWILDNGNLFRAELHLFEFIIRRF